MLQTRLHFPVNNFAIITLLFGVVILFHFFLSYRFTIRRLKCGFLLIFVSQNVYL